MPSTSSQPKPDNQLEAGAQLPAAMSSLPAHPLDQSSEEKPQTPRGRMSLVSLSTEPRPGIILIHDTIKLSDLRRFVAAAHEVLTRETVPPKVMERILAWFIVEAAPRLAPRDAQLVKNQWGSDLELQVIATELQRALNVACEVKSETVADRGGPVPFSLLSSIDSFLKYHRIVQNYGPVQAEYEEDKFFFELKRQCAPFYQFFAEALVCTASHGLPVAILIDLHRAIESTIEGRAVFIHERVLDEILDWGKTHLARSAIQVSRGLSRFEKLLVHYRGVIQPDDGLDPNLEPTEYIDIVARYMSRDPSAGMVLIKKLREVPLEISRAFRKCGVPPANEIETWDPENPLRSWIQYHIKCSPAVAQEILAGNLQQAICDPAETRAVCITIDRCSQIGQVLAILGRNVETDGPLHLRVEGLSEGLLEYLSNNYLSRLSICFPATPCEDWFVTAAALLGVDDKLLQDAFRTVASEDSGSGTSADLRRRRLSGLDRVARETRTPLSAQAPVNTELNGLLGQSGFSRDKLGIIWHQSGGSMSIPLMVQALVKPERQVEIRDVFGRKQAQPLIERLGGRAFLELLEDGFSYSVAQWYGVARRVRAMGCCTVERQIHRFKVELGFLEYEQGITAASLELETEAGKELFITWVRECLKPNNEEESEFSSGIVGNSQAVRGLIKLRACLPELAELSANRSLEVLEAVDLATRGDGQSLVTLLNDRTSRKELEPLRASLFSCLDKESQGGVRAFLRSNVSADLSLENVSLSELTAAAKEWLEIMGFDELNVFEDYQIGTREDKECLERLTARAEGLLSLLIDAEGSCATQAPVSDLGSGIAGRKLVETAEVEIRRAGMILQHSAALATLTKVLISPLCLRAMAESDSIILPELCTLEQVFHEVGHHVEYSWKGLYEICLAFRKLRATSDTPVRLQELLPHGGYDADEMAFPGRYIHPYVGKVYQRKATEVLTMGFQHFQNPKALASLAVRDPEHFLLTLGAVLRCRGEI
jgi:hypothetical protein